jgi:nitrogen fixation NifU-like protein
MAYDQKIIDHFENPRNVGSFPKTAVNIGTGLVGAPECGDVMKLQIQVEEVLRCKNCGKIYAPTSKIKIKSAALPLIIHVEAPKEPHIDIKEVAKALGASIIPDIPCCDNPEIVTQSVIVDSKFKTFGCGSAIASSSLATEWLKGKTLEEANKIRNTDIVSELKLPPVKIHCSVLAEDAIKAAIADYRDKEKKLEKKEEKNDD